MKKNKASGRRLQLRALAAVVLALALAATTLVLLLLASGPPATPPAGHARDQRPQTQPVGSRMPQPRGSKWKLEFPAAGSVRIPLFGAVSAARLFGIFGSVALGTPPQSFKMVFETGEDIVWIPNARAATSTHAAYDHSKSRSYEADGAGATGFGAYYAYLGFVSRDTVHLGDLALPNVSFVEVTRVENPADFEDAAPADGMFGLSPDLERNAVLRRLVRSGALDEPVFTFYFDTRQEAARFATGAAASVGELSVGAVDRRRYTGVIHYVPTIDAKSWRVELAAISVGGTSENFATTEMTASTMRNGRAVVPAEVTPSWPAILGPTEDVKRLAEAVGATGGRIHCSSRGPDIVLRIGGVAYTLTKDDYTLRDSGDDTESCRWAFMGLDLGYWWLGQPFLHKFYSVFEFGGEAGGDSGSPRVGFALAA